MQEERNELKKELLTKKEPELGYWENSWPPHTASMRKHVLKRMVRVQMKSHEVFVWLMDLSSHPSEARRRDAIIPAMSVAAGTRGSEKAGWKEGCL